jgi:triphosphatase
VEAARGRQPLVTLFTIEQRRAERDLLAADGPVVAKLSLDEAVVVRHGRRLGEFATLEVESVSGAHAGDGAAMLRPVADELEASSLLRPEARSKEEIGLAMVAAGNRPTTRPPRKPGIAGDDQLSEAGRKVLRMQLLRMLDVESAARQGGVEGVHKMRVATRRMRAAWRVFEGAYRGQFQRRYVKQLREVATRLGAVRDTDVQLERVEAYAKALPADAAGPLTPFVEELKHRREAARDRLLSLLGSEAYEKFVDDYLEFVDTAEEGAAVDGPGRVRDVSASRVWLAYERVRAHDAVLPFADVTALHAIRIYAKRLRYTIEFLRELLPAAADPVIAEVTAIQDHLGLLNDAQVAADLTRSWLMESAAEITVEAKRASVAYLTASERDVARLRRSFTRLWTRITSRTFRRRLALVASEA